jgi:hypothetical protein
LNRVGVRLQLRQVVTAAVGNAHDVASPIAGVGPSGNLVSGLEPVEDAVDVIAVKAEQPADFGLAERFVILEGGANREVGAGSERHVPSEEPIAGSGLISMEQSAVLMMRRVLTAEVTGGQRVFALVLGPVRTGRPPVTTTG